MQSMHRGCYRDSNIIQCSSSSSSSSSSSVFPNIVLSSAELAALDWELRAKPIDTHSQYTLSCCRLVLRKIRKFTNSPKMRISSRSIRWLRGEAALRGRLDPTSLARIECGENEP